MPKCAECYANIGSPAAAEEGLRRGRGGLQEGDRARARTPPRRTTAWRPSTTRRRSSTEAAGDERRRRPSAAPRPPAGASARRALQPGRHRVERQQDFAEAQEAFEAAVEADPNHCRSALHWLGMANLKLRQAARSGEGVRDLPRRSRRRAERERQEHRHADQEIQPVDVHGSERPPDRGRSFLPLTTEQAIAQNLAEVRARIDAAARRAGRDPSAVTLIAVSKTFSADHVRAAYAAGQRDFGENKVQEALQKIGETADMRRSGGISSATCSRTRPRKRPAPFACIHSIDSVDLLRRWTRRRPSGGAPPRSWCRSIWPARPRSSARPPTRPGASWTRRCEARGRQAGGADAAAALERGPGADAPLVRAAPGAARRVARRGRAGPARCAHLSMGMSHDFEVAIEEGATLVRVGTAIFGKRTRRERTSRQSMAGPVLRPAA